MEETIDQPSESNSIEHIDFNKIRRQIGQDRPTNPAYVEKIICEHIENTTTNLVTILFSDYGALRYNRDFLEILDMVIEKLKSYVHKISYSNQCLHGEYSGLLRITIFEEKY